MQISTTFFENESFYLANYIEWYTKTLNPEKFIFFVGRRNFLESNFNYRGINFLLTESSNIITLEYNSDNNSTSQWHDLKQIFFSIIKTHFNKTPTLFTDCDELLFCKNINQALRNGYIKTHFFEHVPKQDFSLREDMLWSVQPWFYREQALGNVAVSHRDCKIFHIFNPEHTSHMGDRNNYCCTDSTYKDYDNICWHVGIHSKEHYIKNKHWMQTHPDGIAIDPIDRENGVLNHHFEKYYKTCLFETFTLNLSQEYKL
jgi:hypothetical protein